MSLVTIPIPYSKRVAEVEYEQMTIRIKSDDAIDQVYHISGCEIGECCIKDQHSPSNSICPADSRALRHVLREHNFTSAVYDKRQSDGSFKTKIFAIK